MINPLAYEAWPDINVLGPCLLARVLGKRDTCLIVFKNDHMPVHLYTRLFKLHSKIDCFLSFLTNCVAICIYCTECYWVFRHNRVPQTWIHSPLKIFYYPHHIHSKSKRNHEKLNLPFRGKCNAAYDTCCRRSRIWTAYFCFLATLVEPVCVRSTFTVSLTQFVEHL